MLPSKRKKMAAEWVVIMRKSLLPDVCPFVKVIPFPYAQESSSLEKEQEKKYTRAAKMESKDPTIQCLFDFSSDLDLLRDFPTIRAFCCRETGSLLKFRVDQTFFMYPTLTLAQCALLCKEDTIRDLKTEWSVFKLMFLIKSQNDSKPSKTKNKEVSISLKKEKSLRKRLAPRWSLISSFESSIYQSGIGSNSNEEECKVIAISERQMNSSNNSVVNSEKNDSSSNAESEKISKVVPKPRLIARIYSAALRLLGIERKNKETEITKEEANNLSRAVVNFRERMLARKLNLFFCLHDPVRAILDFPEESIR